MTGYQAKVRYLKNGGTGIPEVMFIEKTHFSIYI